MKKKFPNYIIFEKNYSLIFKTSLRLFTKLSISSLDMIYAGLNIEHIDVSEFKTGLYFVNTSLDTKSISKKLVITK